MRLIIILVGVTLIWPNCLYKIQQLIYI